MTFQRIKISDILKPPKNQKTKNPVFQKSKLGFARPFTDHMVLQCDQPIRIWGHSQPKATIKVSLGNSISKTVAADEHGQWMIELPAQKASFDATNVKVSDGAQNIQLHDVLFGEVWICAGQSNMEWELRKSKSGKQMIAQANDRYLRLHLCPGGARGSSGVYNQSHMDRLKPANFSEGTWQVDSPSSASRFSAVGYFFAKHLRSQLKKPVGIISVAVGGTPIESWVSQESLSKEPKLAKMFNGNWLDNPMLDDWCKRRAKQNLKRGLSGELTIPSDDCGPNHSFKPGFMYAAGIRPFVPLSIRGGLWYQGESNADNPARTKIYDACFPLLVKEWRASFKNEALPVVFVQLPAMGRANWPVFREYQRRSLAKLTNVGMAITIDTGDPKNVHPVDKQPVGERLAQWALINTYKQNGVGMGPLYKSKSSVRNTLKLSFDFCGNGLSSRNSKPLNHFEIAGSNGVYHPAIATLDGNQVLLTSTQVSRPVHARYAWKAFPKPFPNLVNSAGLPASPFSTEEHVPE